MKFSLAPVDLAAEFGMHSIKPGASKICAGMQTTGGRIPYQSVNFRFAEIYPGSAERMHTIKH